MHFLKVIHKFLRKTVYELSISERFIHKSLDFKTNLAPIIIKNVYGHTNQLDSYTIVHLRHALRVSGAAVSKEMQWQMRGYQVRWQMRSIRCGG